MHDRGADAHANTVKRRFKDLATVPWVVDARRRFAPQIALFRARLSRDNPAGLRLTLNVLLFIGAIWLFADIAEDVVTRDPLVQMDQWIALWFHAHSTPALTQWMEIVTDAHGTAAISVLGVGFAAYLSWRRNWYWLLTLIVVLPGGMLLNLLLKQMFHRDRPSFDDPLLSLASYSFPSGHVAGATLFYGLLAAFIASRLSTWRGRLLPFVVASALVTAVGVTRMYLGAHFLSDVVAAAAWCIAWLVMWSVVVDWLRRR